MPKRAHLVAGVIATLCIATFFLSTLLVELFGSQASVAWLKSIVVVPGLFILVPAITITGGSGFFLSKSRRGRLVDSKKKRMPFIAANGLIVLVPCAFVLSRWFAARSFDASFYVVQAIELSAGAINLALMEMNIRDGLRISGRLRGTSNQYAICRRGQHGLRRSKPIAIDPERAVAVHRNNAPRPVILEHHASARPQSAPQFRKHPPPPIPIVGQFAANEKLLPQPYRLLSSGNVLRNVRCQSRQLQGLVHPHAPCCATRCSHCFWAAAACHRRSRHSAVHFPSREPSRQSALRLAMTGKIALPRTT